MDSLDPQDWQPLRALGHRMLDDMFDDLAGLRDEPVWRAMPDEFRGELQSGMPRLPTPPAHVYDEFRRLIAPYATGNRHPRFMGWVHGGGSAVGMLADMLASGLNANLGGRDHAPIEIERQVIRWSAEMLGLPRDAGGVLVTGTSIANFIAVLVARAHRIGPVVRRRGLGAARLTAYASAAAHDCIGRAMDMAGLGSDALRLVPVDGGQRMDIAALAGMLRQDRASGATPFLVAGTAGTVDTGAIDDLDAIAEICARQELWFHVDAAFAAMAALSPRFRPMLRGIDRADSVAFDFHKWAQVPYDAGCVLVRDASHQRAAFTHHAAYLRREARGLASGGIWPCDLGPDLSRGFRALKVWMTLKTYGADRIGAVVEQCCDVAQHLAARIDGEPSLERVAPVALNIVCFRPRGASDRSVADLVADLQEQGIAAPSTTTIAGRLAIRAAIVNHRTNPGDADALVDAVLQRHQGVARYTRNHAFA